jgi:hypothetical protein
VCDRHVWGFCGIFPQTLRTSPGVQHSAGASPVKGGQNFGCIEIVKGE